MNAGRVVGTAAMAIFPALILCLYSGCSRHAAVKPSVSSLPADMQGIASFKILTSTPEEQTTNGSTYLEVISPTPIGELKPPAYPENALKARLGPALILARVHLDSAGKVVEIADSPIGTQTQTRFIQEFRTEIDKAVRQWRFMPAELQECERGKDLNGDGKPDYVVVISIKQIPVFFDIQFSFSIVREAGLPEHP
jgi:hypothetical protein